MKLITLPLLLILFLIPASYADPVDDIAALIKQGNTQGIAKYFAPSVEISILGDENVYTKVQSELILDKFFNQNKPSAVKMLHEVSSNPNYRFIVLMLTTGNGPFRVSYTMKQTNGTLMLIALRIETEKVK